MATTSTLIKRFVSMRKNKQKNPDWARVEEPDTIIRPATFGVFGLVVVALSVWLAWIVMTTSPIDAIANFLVSLHSDMPFTQLYAAFASALIVMIDLLVMTIFLFFSNAGNDDVIEMIRDLDTNTQERLVEFENTMREKFNGLSAAQDERDVEFKNELITKVDTIIRLDESMRQQ